MRTGGGTNSEEFRDEFPDLFPPVKPPSEESRHWILTYPGMSPWVRKSMLEGAARSCRGERRSNTSAEAEKNRRLAEEYRRLAKDALRCAGPDFRLWLVENGKLAGGLS